MGEKLGQLLAPLKREAQRKRKQKEIRKANAKQLDQIKNNPYSCINKPNHKALKPYTMPLSVFRDIQQSYFLMCVSLSGMRINGEIPAFASEE